MVYVVSRPVFDIERSKQNADQQNDVTFIIQDV